MTYRSLYRAWRPQSFADVLGQEHVTRTLTNAIVSGRLGHAYLFCGPRGTGKTSTAKILAKALNCEHGPTAQPCDECSLCVRIREGYCLDVLEMDAASNRGIDEIRALRDQVNLTPTEARYKVYIIDEVHMLTAEAFNAFLKTLEEPPERVVFILATTEPERIPATILSRCQRFDFHRLTPEIVRKRLAQVAESEGIQVEARTLALIARSAEGSMRDALGMLDQCISFSGAKIEHQDVLELLGASDGETLTEIIAALGRRDAGGVLQLLDHLRSQGKDPRLLLRDLILWLRNLMLLDVCREPEQLLSLSEEEVAELKRAAGGWSAARVTQSLKELTSQEGALRWSAQPWIVLETTLAGLCLDDPGRVAVRLEAEQAARPATGKTETAPVPPVTRKREEPAAPKVEAPAPVPQVEAALATVQEAWPRVLEEIKSRGPALEAVWRYGKPAALAAGRLTVGFNAAGIRNVAAQPDKLKALEEALATVLNISLKVLPEVLTAAKEKTPEAGSDPEQETEPAGVREARDLFGVDKVVVKDR